MKSVDVIGHKDDPNVALAIDSFKRGEVSLSQSAKATGMTTAAFIVHVSCMGIPVADQSMEEAESDMDTLDKWLAS